MEHALIALVSLSVTLTIYFDRVQRKDMRTGFARVDKRFEQIQLQIDKRFEQVQLQINESNKQVNESIGGLTKSVVELARGVGRAEGRTEVLVTTE